MSWPTPRFSVCIPTTESGTPGWKELSAHTSIEGAREACTAGAVVWDWAENRIVDGVPA